MLSSHLKRWASLKRARTPIAAKVNRVLMNFRNRENSENKKRKEHNSQTKSTDLPRKLRFGIWNAGTRYRWTTF